MCADKRNYRSSIRTAVGRWCGTDLHPYALIPPHSSHKVLEFLSLPEPVLCKLSGVCDLLGGWLEILVLKSLRLPQDLFCCDLQRLIFDISTFGRINHAEAYKISCRAEISRASNDSRRSNLATFNN
jgi:hypothetical protein